jgi:hypothetical protein
MELTDSLRRTMRQGNWSSTVTLTAELGYYVAQLSVPLRNTMNYDGQYTHNNGIKWRFEEEFLERYCSKMFLRRNDPPKFGNFSSDMFSRNDTCPPFAFKTSLPFCGLIRWHFRLGKNSYNAKYYSACGPRPGR